MKLLSFKKINGFSAIETVIAVAIFAGVSIALFGSYTQIMKVVSRSKVRSTISVLASEQFEIIRSLPFNDIGTISGIPEGLIPQSKTIERGGLTFNISTVIRSIDLPLDGVAPSDTTPADNKMAEVNIVCTSCEDLINGVFSAQFGPSGLEGNSTNGSLFIRTIDAAGQPVEGATVHVKVDPPDPIVDLTDITNAGGELHLIGAIPAKNAYQVSVSKVGYTSDMTYSLSGPTTTKPILPHATVNIGTITQLTFVIDKVSTLNISSINPICAPVANTPFTLRGSKIIGYEPVYKYLKTLSTNNLGESVLGDIEWDTYNIEANKTGYDLIGVIPSPDFSVSPNTNQAIQLILVPDGSEEGQNNNTITVSLKDSVTGAQLSGAEIQFEHSLDTLTRTTGRGQLIQTNWVNGGGQVMYDDTSAYESDDGNISVSDSEGAVLLKNTLGVYSLNGELTSSIIDTGASSNFYEFHFSPITKPANTNIQFKLATSNATSGPFVFLGPDGTADSFYTTENSIINGAASGKRYLKYKMYLSTTDNTITPSVEDVSFTFTSACQPPGQAYIQSMHNGSWDITITKDGYETFTDHVTAGGTGPAWLQLSYKLDPL